MKKGTYTNLLVVLFIITMFVGSTLANAYAQKEPENKVGRFFKNLINWPFGITKKTSEAVGRTTKKAVTTVTTTGSSAVETVTGKPEKLETVLTEPIIGSGETAYIAVEGTLKAPIEGTEEVFKSKDAE
ncbi:MAG: hypothetical protein ABH843_01780 [Candidatus Omnitrophota bacterium]